MKLLFRQRFFSWFDSYDIYDEAGNTLFVVKGRPAWGHRLEIYDRFDQHIGTIKEEILAFLPRFDIFITGNYIGQIRKAISFFRPRYQVDFNGWRVEGDLFGWEYGVFYGNEPIMHASKQVLNLTDTYVIDVEKEENMLYSLMVVLAIDAATCANP